MVMTPLRLVRTAFSTWTTAPGLRVPSIESSLSGSESTEESCPMFSTTSGTFRPAT